MFLAIQVLELQTQQNLVEYLQRDGEVVAKPANLLLFDSGVMRAARNFLNRDYLVSVHLKLDLIDSNTEEKDKGSNLLTFTQKQNILEWEYKKLFSWLIRKERSNEVISLITEQRNIEITSKYEM